MASPTKPLDTPASPWPMPHAALLHTLLLLVMLLLYYHFSLRYLRQRSLPRYQARGYCSSARYANCECRPPHPVSRNKVALDP